jgi:predicted glycosyltransferase
VIPRTFPRREQWIRAHTLEQRGLLTTLDLNRLCAPALLAAIQERLDAAPPADTSVDFGGLRRIARRARRLLDLPEPVGAD